LDVITISSFTPADIMISAAQLVQMQKALYPVHIYPTDHATCR
jgi:hypothetical protein